MSARWVVKLTCDRCAATLFTNHSTAKLGREVAMNEHGWSRPHQDRGHFEDRCEKCTADAEAAKGPTP